MPSQSQYVRPGPMTANATMIKRAMTGSPPLSLAYWWVQRVRFSNFTSAATSQALDLSATFASNAFPTNVFLCAGSYVDLIQVFSGGAVATATVILGDAGVTNGLLTSSNVFTGATLGATVTPSATEYRQFNFESAYVPLLTLTTTVGNVNACTQGIVDVYIPYFLKPTNRPVTGF